MGVARALGSPALYGLLAGLIVASGASSVIFFTWMRRLLQRLEAESIAAGAPGRVESAAEPDPGRFTAPAAVPGRGSGPDFRA
jgi:hypothetical protein